jgi:hypothetical protein
METPSREKIFILGFVLGILFSLTGTVGFFSGVATAFFLIPHCKTENLNENISSIKNVIKIIFSEYKWK